MNFLFSALCTFILYSASLEAQVLTVFDRWHAADELIRDRKIDKDDAQDSIEMYVELAKKEFKKLGVPGTKRKDWAFPMSGWSSITYREGGKDYKDDRFDYFQGGESKGHPAHDVFFPDTNKDVIDDVTGEKVYATAMVTGIVFTLHGEWKAGDFFRSGNYVKIFDPETEAMFYYSHLDSVFVKVGQLVKAGDPIGYVGRTGRKAINGRTHVHIAYYKIDDGYPEPEEIITDLYNAEKRLKK